MSKLNIFNDRQNKLTPTRYRLSLLFGSLLDPSCFSAAMHDTIMSKNNLYKTSDLLLLLFLS